MKKFLTFILVLAMVMSVSSFAMAANVSGKDEVLNAISSAPTDGTLTTITLTSDIDLGNCADQNIKCAILIPEGANIKLELNGNNITGTSSDRNRKSYQMIQNNGTLEIVGLGTIAYTYTGIEAGILSDSMADFGTYTITNSGTLTINGATIENNTELSKHTAITIDNNSGSRTASLTVKAGSTVTSKVYRAIRQFANSETNDNNVTIDGGTISGYKGAVWVHDASSKQNKATLTINDGNLSGTTQVIQIWDASSSRSTDNIKVEIKKGNIDGKIVVDIPNVNEDTAEGINGELVILGGTFSEKPAAALIDTNKVALPESDGDDYVIGAKSTESVAIDVSPASLDFESKVVGYSAPDAKKIIVTNIGQGKVYVSQPTDNDYTITIASGDLELEPGESVEFNVVPEAGLSAGQHDATLSINASNYDNPANESATNVMKQVAVRFTVNTAPSSGGYYGPDVWYIGGNTFGTNTNAVPTSVEIDGVPVSFTMNGSQITVDCIQPGSGWVTVRWGSVSNYRSFTPDANAYCAQAVIPKTGDISFWAAIAQFFGF